MIQQGVQQQVSDHMEAVHQNMQSIIDSKVHEKVTLANKDMHAKFE
jgi:hypothetical protein